MYFKICSGPSQTDRVYRVVRVDRRLNHGLRPLLRSLTSRSDRRNRSISEIFNYYSSDPNNEYSWIVEVMSTGHRV